MDSLPNSDRRQFGRRDYQRRAVVLAHGQAPLPCLVKNLSDEGAYLFFTEVPSLPTQFRLRLECDGTERHCCIKHCQGLGVGVQFVDAIAAASNAPVDHDARQPRVQAATQSSGSKLRHEVLGDKLPNEIRPLNLAPGSVIRGVS